MRPRNQAARDRLPAALARRPGSTAQALAAELGVSVPTLHRLLGEHPHLVVAAGRARRARYALRRALRGSLAPLPLYEVQPSGQAQQVGELVLVHPEGSWLSLEGSHWPLPHEDTAPAGREAPAAARDGWWGGLPYPLFDMRPQGYLGRQLALAEHQRLDVAPNPESWSDDQIVHVLSQVGSDTSGSLILGEAAFAAWQQRKLAPPAPIAAGALAARYAELAELAVAQGVAGSSAAGEFPKFPALRELPGSTTPHVLVKFSGALASAPELAGRPPQRSAAASAAPHTTGPDRAVQRWADLLVAEHLALEAAATLPGVVAARSRIVQHGGRTFLEVERFDRHGLFGRSPLVSLTTVDAALLGSGSSDWRTLANRLAAAGWLPEAGRLAVHHLWWFGRLIANSDMHTGNLSFRPAPGAARRPTSAAAPGAGALALAPAYDMLPMWHAPLRGGEVPVRAFEPPLPLPPEQPVWAAACRAALAFWRSAEADARISVGFRALSGETALRLAAIAARL